MDIDMDVVMEKDNILNPARFEQKLFYPRKCKKWHQLWEGDKQVYNDNDTNTQTSQLLDQLGPEGQVGENLPNKKKNLKYYPQKAENCDITNFCDKTAYNLAHILPKLGKKLHQHCWRAVNVNTSNISKGPGQEIVMGLQKKHYITQVCNK